MEFHANKLPTGDNRKFSKELQPGIFFRRRSKSDKAREETYRDWYGSEDAQLEIEYRQKSPRIVGDVLQEVIDEVDQDHHVLLRKIIGEWEKVVSPEIRFHAMPRRIQNDILFIEVYDASWRYYLEVNFKTEIHRLVQKTSDKKIHKIKFIPGGKTRK